MLSLDNLIEKVNRGVEKINQGFASLLTDTLYNLDATPKIKEYIKNRGNNLFDKRRYLDEKENIDNIAFSRELLNLYFDKKETYNILSGHYNHGEMPNVTKQIVNSKKKEDLCSIIDRIGSAPVDDFKNILSNLYEYSDNEWGLIKQISDSDKFKDNEVLRNLKWRLGAEKNELDIISDIFKETYEHEKISFFDKYLSLSEEERRDFVDKENSFDCEVFKNDKKGYTFPFLFREELEFFPNSKKNKLYVITTNKENIFERVSEIKEVDYRTLCGKGLNIDGLDGLMFSVVSNFFKKKGLYTGIFEKDGKYINAVGTAKLTNHPIKDKSLSEIEKTHTLFPFAIPEKDKNKIIYCMKKDKIYLIIPKNIKLGNE